MKAIRTGAIVAVGIAIHQGIAGYFHFSVFCFLAALYLWLISKPEKGDRALSRFTYGVVQPLCNITLVLTLVVASGGQFWILPETAEQYRTVRLRVDYMAFYAGGVLVRESPAELYSPVRQGAAQKAATGMEVSGEDLDFLPFGYPPVLAVVYAPFTFFRYRTAYFLTTLANLALLGASLWILSNRLRLRKKENQMLGICATALISVYSGLLQGQVSFLALFLFALVITNLRIGETGRAGFWSGFLALKPTLLPVVLLWFAVRRSWRALLYASAVAASLAIVSIAIIGVDAIPSYLEMSLRMSNGFYMTAQPKHMANIKALTHFLGLGDLAWLISIAAVAGVFAISTGRRPPNDSSYCALLLAAILVAPHLNIQDLVITLIIVAIVVKQVSAKLSASWRWFLFLMVSIPSAYAVGGMKGGDQTGPYLPVTPLVILGLFLYFSFQNLRSVRVSELLAGNDTNYANCA